jgi:hypothetical protein
VHGPEPPEELLPELLEEPPLVLLDRPPLELLAAVPLELLPTAPLELDDDPLEEVVLPDELPEELAPELVEPPPAPVELLDAPDPELEPCPDEPDDEDPPGSGDPPDEELVSSFGELDPELSNGLVIPQAKANAETANAKVKPIRTLITGNSWTNATTEQDERSRNLNREEVHRRGSVCLPPKSLGDPSTRHKCL